MNESKTFPLGVSLDDMISGVLRKIQNDEDVYVTMHGKVQQRREKLRSCGVTDGCTMQITSRLRGGGRHKDKSKKAERKRGRGENGQEDQQVELAGDGCPEMTQSQKDVVIQMLEGNEGCWKIIKMISETGDEEHGMQCFKVLLQKELGFNQETMKVMEWRVRWAVEARRKGRGEEQEQRWEQEQEQWRQDEQEQREQQERKERRQELEEQRREAELGQNAGQEHNKQGRQVRFSEEEQLEETRAENADEPEVTGRLAEVRTGRGSAGLVRGRDERYWADESSWKGKG